MDNLPSNMKLLFLTLAAGSIAFGQSSDSSDKTIDCGEIYKKASKEIAESKKSDSDVLKLVRLYAQRYPSCLCEVVKASIVGSEANKGLVKSIVETAIVAAPDQLDAIVNCSIAIAPDAATEIASVANQFTDGKATVSKKSNILYLSGKNSYSGGKNGYGKNGDGGAANEAPASEPIATNALDNLGAGTANVGFQPDAGIGSTGIPGTTSSGVDNIGIDSSVIPVNPIGPDLFIPFDGDEIDSDNGGVISFEPVTTPSQP